jgi:mRNA interferase RelE/StbE
MIYSVSITKKAQKFISAQPKNKQAQLLKAINKLPDTGDVKPIAGKDNMYRLRVGDYRVIYVLNRTELLIIVANAGNRGQIYKNI